MSEAIINNTKAFRSAQPMKISSSSDVFKEANQETQVLGRMVLVGDLPLVLEQALDQQYQLEELAVPGVGAMLVVAVLPPKFRIPAGEGAKLVIA